MDWNSGAFHVVICGTDANQPTDVHHAYYTYHYNVDLVTGLSMVYESQRCGLRFIITITRQRYV